MKKIIYILIGLYAVLTMSACGSAMVEKDVNGKTPKDVVNDMYTAIQHEDFDAAVACCNVPDTIVVKNMDGTKDTVADNPQKVAQTMKNNYQSKIIESWEITEESGDKTDPNLATVKAKVTFVADDTKSTIEAVCPMKKGRDNVWKVNG